MRTSSVSICGELAGDPRAAPLLVAMGFDQLSMNAGSLSLVKRVLSAFSAAELADLMATLLPLRSAQEVDGRLRFGTESARTRYFSQTPRRRLSGALS